MKKNKFDTYVFTTKHVVEKNSQIVYISHDEDGDWQFLGAENNLSESDAMIVSLGEIIEMDKSILEALKMPMGKIAIRNSINDTWEIV